MDTLVFFSGLKSRFKVSDLEWLVVALLCCWFRRNSSMHAKPEVPVADILPWSAAFLEVFQGVRAAGERQSTQYYMRRWSPPVMELFKVKCDALLRAYDRLVGLGFVIRDHLGAVMASE
ncbi:hypothetical protein ACOSQ4_007433 [Xanthoceras sorbifolium]